MKIPALLAALAIASGSALAAGNSGDATHRGVTADSQHSAATDTSPHRGASFVEKTKRAFRRMGDKLANATHTDKNREESTARGSDTRAMGAAGSDTHDSGRQRRMDDAYSNYRGKQDNKR